VSWVQVILMDHADWLCEDKARELAAGLAQQVVPGGRVIWRSASISPPYAKFIKEAGFEVGGWVFV
jgi:betaine lipid synthase